MTRLAPSLAVAAILLLFALPAFAVGGILATPGENIRVVDVRYALAMSAAQTTRWASIRVGRFPGAMAWVLPIRPGAKIEEVGNAWFEALELATAPRVVAPVCADAGAAPKVVIEARPALGPGVRSLRSVVLDDMPALRAFAQSFGFDLPPAMDARFTEVVDRGFQLLTLVYGGAAEGAATRTVRITDDAFPWVPLLLTAAADDAVPVTTFVVADNRTRLGSGPEMEVEGSRISVAKEGTTNYGAELRALLLGGNGASWASEAASHEILFEGARAPAGVEPSHALAPTYFRIAAGDDHTDASDLTMALFGLDLSYVWVTRVSGVIRPREFGDDLAVTRRDAQPKSPFIAASGSPPSCPVTDGGRGGTGDATGGGPVEPPRPPPPTLPPPTTTLPPTVPPNLPPSPSVGMSCSCSPGPGSPDPVSSSDDSCEGSDPGAASGSQDGCDGSTDDGYDAGDDTSDDGCDGSTDDGYDSGDDGCDGSSSSGSGDGDGDGCSSGSPDGGDSDGCSSTNSSSRSEGCSTAPSARSPMRTRRLKASRTRVSLATLTLAAIALVVRRTTKRVERDRRTAQED